MSINHYCAGQSDRTAPRNLRQRGGANVDLLIPTEIRKSSFRYLSVVEGVRQTKVYNDKSRLGSYIDLEDEVWKHSAFTIASQKRLVTNTHISKTPVV